MSSECHSRKGLRQGFFKILQKCFYMRKGLIWLYFLQNIMTISCTTHKQTKMVTLSNWCTNWLEYDKHYNLVLNFRQFMFGWNNNFCIKCMKYSGKASNHICFSQNACFRCYSIHSEGGETFKNPIKCLLCNILFY